MEEQISIRDLKSILEGITELRNHIPADTSRYIAFALGSSMAFGAGEKQLDDFTTEDYAEHLRNFLKRYISFKFTRGTSKLWVYLIDPAVEAWLENCDDPMGDDRLSHWLMDARRKIDNNDQRRPVILTGTRLRGRVRRLIAAEFPRIPVLSYQELTPDMDLEPIARIAFRDQVS